MLIGSYNTNYSRRQLWIYAAAFSAFCICVPVVFLTWQGPNRMVVAIVVLDIIWWLAMLAQCFFVILWRVELTADELRWHTALTAEAVSLSQVRSIRRAGPNIVLVEFEGRRRLRIDARSGRLGTFVVDIKIAAPHVTAPLGL